jgi:hypothetical protein
MAEIAEITRTYGGLEGRRVKAGTRFAVGQASDGLPTITKSRFQQLKDAGLARPWDPKASPGRPVPLANVSPAGQSVRQAPLNRSRTATKAALKNAGAPSEPRPLVNPAGGSPILETVKLESLSPEAQASAKSNLGLRGRRALSASPSTTPGKLPPGPDTSTPATERGGPITKDAQNSTA